MVYLMKCVRFYVYECALLKSLVYVLCRVFCSSFFLLIEKKNIPEQQFLIPTQWCEHVPINLTENNVSQFEYTPLLAYCCEIKFGNISPNTTSFLVYKAYKLLSLYRVVCIILKIISLCTFLYEKVGKIAMYMRVYAIITTMHVCLVRNVEIFPWSGCRESLGNIWAFDCLKNEFYAVITASFDCITGDRTCINVSIYSHLWRHKGYIVKRTKELPKGRWCVKKCCKPKWQYR